MTLIDLYRDFSSDATSMGYTTSSRILYYTMLWCWNEQRRPEITAVSTKQLLMFTGLPEATFRNAFTYLADRGWIKRVKLRNRGITAWLMRNGRGNAAPPAGFPLDAPAQRVSEEGEKSAPPRADFNPVAQEDTEHSNDSPGIPAKPETSKTPFDDDFPWD